MVIVLGKDKGEGGKDSAPMVIGTRIQWHRLKKIFLESNKNTKVRANTLKSLSEHYGLNPKTVQNYAAQNHWYRDLRGLQEGVTEAVTEDLKKRELILVDKVQEKNVNKHLTVRLKHATLSRALQNKAIKVLNQVDISDISVKDAISMLRLGLEEERRALGIIEGSVLLDDNVKDTGDVGFSFEGMHKIIDEVLLLAKDPIKVVKGHVV